MELDENSKLYTIVLVVVSVNVFLTGVYKALEVVKDKTATQTDNKIYAFLGSLTGIVKKLLDAIGFNPKHK